MSGVNMLGDRQSFEERFFKYVVKTESCWEWSGATNGRGYGRFKFEGKSVYAHRMSYYLHKGPIMKGEGHHGTCVCHTCNNRSCVNPEHLYLGTQNQNLRQMVLENRQARGEVHGRSKLTEKEISDIRLFHKVGDTTQQKLADKYGVSLSLINFIVNNKRWRY